MIQVFKHDFGFKRLTVSRIQSINMSGMNGAGPGGDSPPTPKRVNRPNLLLGKALKIPPRGSPQGDSPRPSSPHTSHGGGTGAGSSADDGMTPRSLLRFNRRNSIDSVSRLKTEDRHVQQQIGARRGCPLVVAIHPPSCDAFSPYTTLPAARAPADARTHPPNTHPHSHSHPRTYTYTPTHPHPPTPTPTHTHPPTHTHTHTHTHTYIHTHTPYPTQTRLRHSLRGCSS
jgi:hypothetical protein